LIRLTMTGWSFFSDDAMACVQRATRERVMPCAA
jgi:hypothetical protein